MKITNILTDRTTNSSVWPRANNSTLHTNGYVRHIYARCWYCKFKSSKYRWSVSLKKTSWHRATKQPTIGSLLYDTFTSLHKFLFSIIFWIFKIQCMHFLERTNTINRLTFIQHCVFLIDNIFSVWHDLYLRCHTHVSFLDTQRENSVHQINRIIL